MAENPAQTPTRDAFVLFDYKAYAWTDIETFEVAEYLLTKLEPTNLEDLDPADRVCVICQHEFRISEHDKRSHTPVKTPCGHVFGKKSIMKWLEALNFWGLEEEYRNLPAEDIRLVTDGKTSCPVCRREFFPDFWVESLELLTQRLFLWDEAYSRAGIATSDLEQHTRKILWEYVDNCHSMDELEHDGERAKYHAKRAFVRWLKALKTQDLTDRQKYLRKKLKLFYRTLPSIGP